MKHFIYSIVVCVCFVAIPAFAFAQDVAKSVFKYDNAGNVKSVTFSASDKEYEHVKSADVFFREILPLLYNGNAHTYPACPHILLKSRDTTRF